METLRCKKVKPLRILLSVLLAFVTAFLGSLALVAQSQETHNYLLDVKVFYGESWEEAKAAADPLGYKLVPGNLNANTSSDQHVYLGYTTTTNRDFAITRVAMLGMETGYQSQDYSVIAEAYKSRSAALAAAMDATATEMADYYELGSPKALDAYRGLNFFYVDEANNMPLGDYVVNRMTDQDFFMDLMTRASVGTVESVISYLNIGAAPYCNDVDEEGEDVTVTWAEKVRSSYVFEMLDEGMTADQEQDLHRQFSDGAQKLFVRIQEFTTNYENALARKNAGTDGQPNTEIDTPEDAADVMEDLREEDADPLYLAAYELLNLYDYSDVMKLGDWIVRTGKKTADTMDITELYPVVESMSDAQIGMVGTAGLLAAISNLGENIQSEEFDKIADETEKEIKRSYGTTAVSIWTSVDQDIFDHHVALTSEAIRQQGAGVFGKSSQERFDEKYELVMKWITIGTGALTVLCFLGKVIIFAIIKIAALHSAAAAAAISASTVVTSILGIIAKCNKFLLWVGILILITVVVVALYRWISKLIEDSKTYELYTEMPYLVYDTVTTDDGVYDVKYKIIRNQSDGGGDLNAYDAQKWTCIYYTRNACAGSPIMEDENGTMFKVTERDGNLQSGFAAMTYFGERSPGNTNQYAKKDDGGVYVCYRTEHSLGLDEAPDQPEQETAPVDEDDETPAAPPEETDLPKDNGPFVRGIIVETGASVKEAQDKIRKRDKKFYIYDVNLSPDTGIYTYLAYELTEKAEDAIRDIRVAPYQGRQQVYHGDISYGPSGVLGYVTDDAVAAGMDGLYATADPRAGTPIRPEGLHVTRGFSETDIQPGWEPVSPFSNSMPYDFNTSLHSYSYNVAGDAAAMVGVGVHGYMLNGYESDDGYRFRNHTPLYLYYEPEVTYTEGTQYCTGFCFVGGCSLEDDPYQYIKDHMDVYEAYPRSDLFYPNLFYTACLPSADENTKITAAKYLYMFYTWSYNPYRAIYDATVYQGTTTADESLPYTVRKAVSFPSREESGGMQIGGPSSYESFTACHVYWQGANDGVGYRCIMDGNCFMNRNVLLHNYNQHKRYTDTTHGFYCKPVNNLVDYGDAVGTKPLTTGLYVAGSTEGLSPLRLRDVIVSTKVYETKNADGSVGKKLPKKALNGYTQKGKFRPVTDIRDPNSDQPFPIYFPKLTSAKGGLGTDGALYIYVRGERKAAGKYVSRVAVGSYSRQQYRQTNPNAKEEELEQVDKLVEEQAVVAAIADCTDEVIMKNIAADQSRVWYNRRMSGNSAKIVSTVSEKDTPAAYIGVSRTDDPKEAVRGLLLYRTDARTAPGYIKVNGMDYYCISVQSPIIMNGKQYFLFFTFSTGATPGTPLTGISVNADVFVTKTVTALVTDKTDVLGGAEAQPYGVTDLPTYIHAAYEKSPYTYYNKFYIGRGDSKKAAMCDLLEQGCTEFCDIDLNEGAGGDYIYFGFRTYTVDWEKINSQTTAYKRQTEYNRQMREAIWDVVCTVGEPYHKDGIVGKNNVFYAPVAPVDLQGNFGDGVDLNRGAPYGYEIYMYFSNTWYANIYNNGRTAGRADPPEEVFSAPLTKLGFARYDRVPYNTALEGTQSGGETVYQWEYVMQANNARQVDFNAGVVNVNGAGVMDDIRVTMFAQRGDGSVKPSAQITGGFVSDVMKLCEMHRVG